MHTSKALPTKLAKVLAIGVDLYIPDKRSAEMGIYEYEDLRERLAQFQQLSFTTDFDTALLVYLGIDMETHKEEKLRVLKMIYDTTKDWLLGHVMGVMLDKLESKIISGKDAAEISNLLMEIFKSNGKADAKTRKSLLVKLQNIEGIEVDLNGED